MKSLSLKAAAVRIKQLQKKGYQVFKQTAEDGGVHVFYRPMPKKKGKKKVK